MAGWTPGVLLDETGREQTKALAQRLAELNLDGFVSSPLERCRETAEILSVQHNELPVNSDLDLAEARYGDWTGRKLTDLRKDPLWDVVAQTPSMVTFPGGESLAGMQGRALAGIRRWNKRYGPDGIYVAVSHGDVIKAILADALGMHLDMFQRIVVEPCSLSVVQYSTGHPVVLRINDMGGDLSAFKRRQTDSTGRVGGGDVL